MRSRNNCRLTDMTGHILLFVHPEFSVIIEMIGYFFFRTTGKELLEYLERFKQLPRFFTDENLITNLRSIHIQLYRWIASLIIQ